jgi:hypothetical protein
MHIDYGQNKYKIQKLLPFLLPVLALCLFATLLIVCRADSEKVFNDANDGVVTEPDSTTTAPAGWISVPNASLVSDNRLSRGRIQIILKKRLRETDYAFAQDAISTGAIIHKANYMKLKPEAYSDGGGEYLNKMKLDAFEFVSDSAFLVVWKNPENARDYILIDSEVDKKIAMVLQGNSLQEDLNSALSILSKRFNGEAFSYLITVNPSWIFAEYQEKLFGVYFGRFWQGYAVDRSREKELTAGTVLSGDSLTATYAHSVIGRDFE